MAQSRESEAIVMSSHKDVLEYSIYRAGVIIVKYSFIVFSIYVDLFLFSRRYLHRLYKEYFHHAGCPYHYIRDILLFYSDVLSQELSILVSYYSSQGSDEITYCNFKPTYQDCSLNSILVDPSR